LTVCVEACSPNRRRMMMSSCLGCVGAISVTPTRELAPQQVHAGWGRFRGGGPGGADGYRTDQRANARRHSVVVAHAGVVYHRSTVDAAAAGDQFPSDAGGAATAESCASRYLASSGFSG